MTKNPIIEIAEGFGLTVESAFLPEHENALRVYKGAHQVFIGTEEAVRIFLTHYKKDRPGLLESSMYAYKE